MNKKMFTPLLTLIFLLAFAMPVAATSAEVEIQAPLEHAIDKTEGELDQYLEKMDFTSEELGFMSLDLKKDIAGNGGVKIKAEKLDPEITVVNELGEISPPSDNISIQDIKTGIFEMYGYAIRNGSANSNENSYSIYAQYRWERTPFNYYTDTLAMAWQAHATPYGSPYSVHNLRRGSLHNQWNNVLQKTQNQGNSFEIDIVGSEGVQDGYAKQDIRVSKRNSGGTASVELGYSHRNVPVIAVAVLDYLSIDFSGLVYTQYFDRFNFTY